MAGDGPPVHRTPLMTRTNFNAYEPATGALAAEELSANVRANMALAMTLPSADTPLYDKLWHKLDTLTDPSADHTAGEHVLDVILETIRHCYVHLTEESTAEAVFICWGIVNMIRSLKPIDRPITPVLLVNAIYPLFRVVSDRSFTISDESLLHRHISRIASIPPNLSTYGPVPHRCGLCEARIEGVQELVTTGRWWRKLGLQVELPYREDNKHVNIALQMRCGHVVCHACLEKWVRTWSQRRRDTCPFCRRKLEPPRVGTVEWEKGMLRNGVVTLKDAADMGMLGGWPYQ